MAMLRTVARVSFGLFSLCTSLLVACDADTDSSGDASPGTAGAPNAGTLNSPGGAGGAAGATSGGAAGALVVGGAGASAGTSGAAGAGGPGGSSGSSGSAGTAANAGSGGNGGAGASSVGGTAGTTGGGTTGGSGGQGGSGGSVAGNAGAADPAVRFVGRVDTSDAMGARFAWSGSGVIARFSGTSVGVRLAGGQQYTVVLDGEVQPKLIPAAGVTSIKNDLAPGEHTVELYRRTEANQGEAQFLGFDFGAGALLAPPPVPARRIEVIGDSITCGYGNEGPNMSCPFTPDTENHYLTYAAISARELGAELSTVAWSGKGVVCNYGDEPSSA